MKKVHSAIDQLILDTKDLSMFPIRRVVSESGKGWEVSETIEQPQSSKIAIEWYQAKFQQTLLELEKSFDQYRVSEALMSIYKLIWDDFSSWF